MVKCDSSETAFLDVLCDEDKNAVDVGANKGVYSDLILPLCGHLYVYERKV